MLSSFRGSPTQVIRHLTSNILITVKDDNTAEGVTYYLAFHNDPGTATAEAAAAARAAFSLGEWHDKFVKTPAGLAHLASRGEALLPARGRPLSHERADPRQGTNPLFNDNKLKLGTFGTNV